MTLKEKFEIATDGWIVADKCEIITNEFAIEFAEWMSNNMVNLDTDYKKEHFKVLLNEFKKEKGL